MDMRGAARNMQSAGPANRSNSRVLGTSSFDLPSLLLLLLLLLLLVAALDSTFTVLRAAGEVAA